MRFPILIVTTICAVVFCKPATAQQPFETKIDEVPFARIAEPHEIDRRCPATGKNDGNVFHYAQNAAKNNFKAKGTPVAVSIRDFTRLQQASQRRIESGAIVLQGKYPTDRARLKNLITVRGKRLGEGSLVTFEAYIFSARYANTKYTSDSQGQPHQGEAVDCDNPELDWNDIHLALSAGDNTLADECTTVTAEISPHYRPALWSRFHDGQNPEIENVLPGLLQGRVLSNPGNTQSPLRVRLTGPLFYDASHQPCKFSGGKIVERHTPERRSIWEIHPLYRIQIWEERRQRWRDFDNWAKARQ